MTDDSYFCVNAECDFFVWKATKGRPVIGSDDMKVLLDTGKLEKLTAILYLTNEAPFITVERKERIPIDKSKLVEFLGTKGITPVDKTANGGAFWIPGDNDIKPILKGIESAHNTKISFSKDSKALKHKPGWCIKAESIVPDQLESINTEGR